MLSCCTAISVNLSLESRIALAMDMKTLFVIEGNIILDLNTYINYMYALSFNYEQFVYLVLIMKIL